MDKVGLTIGKFAPFHKGHEYLIKTALQEVDKLYVMVYETKVINIPISTRAKWIKQVFPQVEILYAENPPDQYGLDEQSVRIQTEYIKEKTKGIPITHFFSGEPYGKYAAQAMKVEERTIDPYRIHIPICASRIRENVEEYKGYIADEIYQEIKQDYPKRK